MRIHRCAWNFFLFFAVLGLAAPGLLAPLGSAVKFATAASIGSYPNVSANWAGYAATSGNYTAVSGTWVVPSVKPSISYRADAAWVGIGGVSSSDLIQAGTSATTGTGGATAYNAWIEMLPAFSQPVPVAVRPGDSVSVSIAQQPSGKWLIAVADNTSGQKYKTTVSYKSSLSSAEWVEEMPSDGTGLIALDSFSKVNFSGGSAVKNGSKVSIAKSGAQQLAMASSSGRILAVPSALSGTGSSFSVSRGSGLELKNARLVRSFTHSRR